MLQLESGMVEVLQLVSVSAGMLQLMSGMAGVLHLASGVLHCGGGVKGEKEAAGTDRTRRQRGRESRAWEKN